MLHLPGLQLSIIIVNYNVKFFLEQCLCSIEKAIQNIIAEVWVVDNASTDGSIDYLKDRFPFVKFMCNETNVGFAKANNLALKQCSGDFVLFLNPDTILPEDCLLKTLLFIEERNDAGATGIRMIDGSGVFLPESKRSFPSITTSFYKLAGLTALFPKSKIFARYNLGYLDEHTSHEVDVLSGAFFIARRELLLKLNGFDESFFMYGEDIDLSYRIQKSGFKNYYFAGSSIIHFKGESTKKGSLNYVRMFYKAMSIFVQKHYSSGISKVFSFFIELAIWFRAAITAAFSFLLKLGLPFVDTIIVFGSFKLVMDLWVSYLRGGNAFITERVSIMLPLFTLIFIVAASIAGLYDYKYRTKKITVAASVAIVVMLAAYSLVPETHRFSRGVILLGGITASCFIVLLRWLLIRLKIADTQAEATRKMKTLIVGSALEFQKVIDLLDAAGFKDRVLGRVSVSDRKEDALVQLESLLDVVETAHVREVIFCEGEMTFAAIIEKLQQLPDGIKVRVHAKKSNSIVGSDSKDTAGESVSADGNFNLSSPYQRRMKRLVDIVFSLFILVTFPIQLLAFGTHILYEAFLVLKGAKTWIGYMGASANLPKLSTGVLSATGVRLKHTLYIDKTETIDKLYAKEYDWWHDVKLLVKHYPRI